MGRPASDSSVFTAIADPTRRAILDMLREGERPVSVIAEEMPLSASALSQHLAVLRRAGLVSQRRDGRHRHYAVRPAPLHEVAAWIAAYDKFWDNRLEKLAKHLDSAARERDAEAKRRGARGGGSKR